MWPSRRSRGRCRTACTPRRSRRRRRGPASARGSPRGRPLRRWPSGWGCSSPPTGRAAVGLWLVNRLLDGLDGALARRTGRQSDLGAYADILSDVAVYAAIPVGIAAGQGGEGAWIAAGVLLATFYVNAIAWSYLSALLERRGAGAGARGEATSVTMPPGLIEGAETVVLFTIALAVPDWSVAVMWTMAAGVAVSVAQRALWAARHLEAA